MTEYNPTGTLVCGIPTVVTEAVVAGTMVVIMERRVPQVHTGIFEPAAAARLLARLAPQTVLYLIIPQQLVDRCKDWIRS